jgi:hypothetical protein
MPKTLRVIDVLPLERNLDLDPFVDLLTDLDQLGGILELRGVRDLRFLVLVFLYEAELSPAVWHNTRKDIAEILIKLEEVLLKSLLLLLIKFLQKLKDAFFSLKLLCKLLLKFRVLGRVLIEPFNAVSVLPWEVI